MFSKTFNKRLLIYLVFWAVSFYVCLEVFSRTGEIRTIDIIYTFLFHVPLLLIVSIHSFHLIPNYLAKSKFWLYGLTLIIQLGVAYPIYNFSYMLLSEWLFPNYYVVGAYNPLEIIGFVTIYLVVSSSLEFGRSWFDALKSKNRIVELESEKVSAELKALRVQVNPHFLFNSLNTIYSEALKKSDKAPDLILKLSDMLRYVVDKMEQDEVQLKEEFEYLSHYVELNKERLNNPEKVSYTTSGEFSGLKVAPLLLIIFVENCFKHSDLTDDNAFIDINLHVNNGVLSLNCKNTVFRKESEGSQPRTGIENARRRLKLAYQNRHSLEINEGSDFYETTLKIKLDRCVV